MAKFYTDGCQLASGAEGSWRLFAFKPASNRFKTKRGASLMLVLPDAID